MNCPKCNHENEESAMYCRHCGAPLHEALNCAVNPKESNTSDILLLIWVIATAVLGLGIFLFTRYLCPDWVFHDSMKFVYLALSVLVIFNNLLPALAIRNKKIKITGIVFISIWIIWSCFRTIEWVLELPY